VLLAEAAVLVVLLAFTAARCAYLSIRNEARRRREAVKTAHDPHAAAVRDAPLGLGL
jgi:hypothetical protein